MSKTLTLEADVNAVDTEVNMTAQGSVSAPSRVTPSKASRITGIVAAAGVDGAAEGAAVFLLRLGGNAIRRGEQTLTIGAAAANSAQAGADAGPISVGPVLLENLDIEVDPSEVIDVSAELAGEDLGDTTVVCTLIFDKG